MSNAFCFTAEQLSAGYDKKPLIRGMSFRLEAGEIMTLIGPNGAGKSTLLRTIARLLRPLSGMAYVGEEDFLSMSGRQFARKTAVLLTGQVRPEMMTCLEMAAAGRYPYTGLLGLQGEEDRRKTLQALETVRALDIKDRDFNSVSDGQKQRVLLAKAICQEPELIVLDEPTTFLDARAKLEFITILKQLARERGIAVILSLHELDLAQKISDYILCVRDGLIDRAGTPEEIFRGGYIRELYGMEEGSYNEAFGSIELPPPRGAPEVFVIAGGGSGIPVYRMLQRRGIPFATGILQANDVDAQLALHLSGEVILSPPFTPASETELAKAEKVLSSCRKVYCPLTSFGPDNEKNRLLLTEAERLGILESLP